MVRLLATAGLHPLTNVLDTPSGNARGQFERVGETTLADFPPERMRTEWEQPRWVTAGANQLGLSDKSVVWQGVKAQLMAIIF